MMMMMMMMMMRRRRRTEDHQLPSYHALFSSVTGAPLTFPRAARAEKRIKKRKRKRERGNHTRSLSSASRPSNLGIDHSSRHPGVKKQNKTKQNKKPLAWDCAHRGWDCACRGMPPLCSSKQTHHHQCCVLWNHIQYLSGYLFLTTAPTTHLLSSFSDITLDNWGYRLCSCSGPPTTDLLAWNNF